MHVQRLIVVSMNSDTFGWKRREKHRLRPGREFVSLILHAIKFSYPVCGCFIYFFEPRIPQFAYRCSEGFAYATLQQPHRAEIRIDSARNFVKAKPGEICKQTTWFLWYGHGWR